ncbi:MAG: MarR family transcriptional regulator [Clostridia bacterium]|nr:MarR family transcriptional regulator [Clostridia bacterium]
MNSNTEQNAPTEKQETGFDAFNSLIGNAMKHIEKLKSRGMNEYDLSGTHTLCMRRLYQAENGLTRTELAQACQMDRAQITRIIEKLLAKKLVIEVGTGSGYRKKCILTPTGREIAADINDRVERIQAFVSGDIPPDQLDNFYKTLHLICDNLKEAEKFL